MPAIFRLDASIRAEGSVTRAIADNFLSTLAAGRSDLTVVRRDIGLDPLPSTAWAGAVFGGFVPPGKRSPAQEQGIALATELADELIAADAFVFAVPFYNFGVSQHFKAWVDIVLAEPRFAPGAAIQIEGRPATLIVARGGGYSPGTPRHGWDHGTDWYRRVLADIWKLDVSVIECDLTLADVTPAMEGLRGMAAENLSNAHGRAQALARQMATGLTG